jgi:hypothetical protein
MSKPYILTPSNRECNLPPLARAITEAHRSEFDLTWLIVFDFSIAHVFLPETLAMIERYPFIQYLSYQEERPCKEIPQLNKALALSPDDAWVWTIADDTLPHSRFFARLRRAIDAHPDKGPFVFSELRHGTRHVLHARPEAMQPNHVDGTQPVIRRSLYGNHRFNMSRTADGEMIQLLYRLHPEQFVFIDEVFCFFEGAPSDLATVYEKGRLRE